MTGDAYWSEQLRELLRAVETTVPVPVRAVDRPFVLSVENAVTITGRGTVVTGLVEAGTVGVGDAVELVGFGTSLSSVCTGLETFGKTLERAEAGDNAAMLLRGVRREDVRRRQVVARPARSHLAGSSPPRSTC